MNTLLKASCLALFTIAALVAAPHRGEAASAAEIEADANATLHSFVDQVSGARELANKAAGILVFPSVIKAGIGFGGEYGEGILLDQHRVVGYYNLVSASFGFQLGVTPKRKWRDEAIELARVIARRPPLATRLAKQAVLSAEEMPLAAGLAHERRLYELAMATEDRVEGMQAFIEKRRPSFRGR